VPFDLNIESIPSTIFNDSQKDVCDRQVLCAPFTVLLMPNGEKPGDMSMEEIGKRRGGIWIDNLFHHGLFAEE
jgi:hypothetical protein